jgi:hypothetical protein
MFSALGASPAPGLKASAVLIWATNDETSPDPTHKPAEPGLAEHLGHNYKWKYYFEVKRIEATIAEGATNKFVMSEKSTVEVKNLGSNRVGVEVFGDGKSFCKETSPFPPGCRKGYAGPVGDNKTAWFVFIQNMAVPPPAPPEPASTNKAPPKVSTNSPPQK